MPRPAHNPHKTACKTPCDNPVRYPVQYPRLGVPFFGDCRLFARPRYRKGITIRGKQ